MSVMDRLKSFAARTTAGNKAAGRKSTQLETLDGVKDIPRAGVLYEEQAVDVMLRYLTQFPDPDETLRAAGVHRYQLKTLETDDEIFQALDTRRTALMGTPMHLEPNDGELSEFVESQLRPCLRQILEGAFKAVPYGFSVLEAVYVKLNDGRTGLRSCGEKPMQWFTPTPDGRLLYNGTATLVSTLMHGEEVDQGFKFFMTRQRPTYENPYGEALLSRLYWPWFFRTNGWKFWAKFLERFGQPMLVGKSKNTEAMAKALMMAHNQAVMGIGQDDSVDAVGVSGVNGGDAFDRFEAALIRRMQKVILGQTLTSGTDNGSGNRALGQVHNEVRKDKLDNDIMMVTDTVQRVVDAILVLNGRKPKEVVVSFHHNIGLETERAARDKDLYDIGVRFKPEYIVDHFDIQAEEFEMSEEKVPDPLAQQQGNNLPNDKKDVKAAKLFTSAFINHAPATRFTRQQQQIEDLVDNAQAQGPKPLDRETVRQAILAAKDPEDLQERLYTLVGESPDFERLLSQALFAADVIGYVHADGKE